MKHFSLVFVFIFSSFNIQQDFISQQKKYDRVRTAISEKTELISKKLKEKDIQVGELNMMILVYKAEQVMEIYAKKKTESGYQLLATYKICSSSGLPGPKRQQGDNQVPEGFYFISQFNPLSSYYLSLGVSYPNRADQLKSKSKNLGGDIFIHGSCVTIGCMPMTDDKIKEIYLCAIHAKNNGQSKIPVYIFPFKMSDQNMATYKTKYAGDTEMIGFWSNLKNGYEEFMKNKNELKFSIDRLGNYVFRK